MCSRKKNIRKIKNTAAGIVMTVIYVMMLKPLSLISNFWFGDGYTPEIIAVTVIYVIGLLLAITVNAALVLDIIARIDSQKGLLSFLYTPVAVVLLLMTTGMGVIQFLNLMGIYEIEDKIPTSIGLLSAVFAIGTLLTYAVLPLIGMAGSICDYIREKPSAPANDRRSSAGTHIGSVSGMLEDDLASIAGLAVGIMMGGGKGQ